MAKRMQTIILFLAVMLFALSANGQQYEVAIDNFAPCNLIMSKTGIFGIEENFLVEELTWIEQSPNKIVIRDDERTIVLRDNQIDSLFNERTGFVMGQPITQADVIAYLEVAKTGCMNRIVGDTIFMGLDTLVVGGGGGANIYNANGTTTDPIRTLTILDEIEFNKSTGAEVHFGDSVLIATSVNGSLAGTLITDGVRNDQMPMERITSALLVGDVVGFTRGTAIFVQDTLTGQQARNFVIDGSAFRPYTTVFAGQAVENTNGDIAQNSFEFSAFGADTIVNSFMESVSVTDNQAVAQILGTAEGTGEARMVASSRTENGGQAFSILRAETDTSLGGVAAASMQVNTKYTDETELVAISLEYDRINIGNISNATSYQLPVTRGTLDQVLQTDGSGIVTWQDAAGLWENVGGTRQLIELKDTSVQIQDSLLLLNGANIEDNKGREIAVRQKFGYLMSTYAGFNPDLTWSPDTDPKDVWVNTNPLTKTYKWKSFYGLREQNFVLPSGTGAEQAYSAVLNSDGNIWNIGFDWGGGYIINPNNNDIERITEGVGIAGQAMVNPRDGLTYITAISFNSMVQNAQLRKVALPGYPAFDVSLGFTRFNTGMGGAIASINNTLYSAPYDETQTLQIAKYDLTNNTGAFLAGSVSPTGSGNFAYTSCAEGVDGRIYCINYDNDYFLEIDPNTDTWIQWGNGNANPVIGQANGGWALINHPNGKMYVPPFVGAQTLEIDPILKTVTPIGTVYPTGGADDMKWGSAALHTNGKIYCFPYTDQVGNVLVIDPATGTTSTIAITTTHAYWSTKIALNGSLWGLPAFGNQTVTRLDLQEPTQLFPIDLVTSPQFSSR